MLKNRIKKFLVGLLTWTVFFSSVPLTLLPARASSVPSDLNGHWAKPVIMQWVAFGLGSGYPDGTFKPDKPVTRAEFAIMANKTFGITSGGEATFTDCDASKWYYNDLAAAFNRGYITGYKDGTVKPTTPITRQEAALMLAKLLHLQSSTAAQFTDSAQLPVWAAGSAAAIANAGVMKGYPDGSFRGSQVISRAEAVVALMKASGKTAEPIAITSTAIDGVTAPMKNAVPVTTLPDATQYTGTITWAGNPPSFATDNFAGSTIYTATITLIPKPGYTLVGVAKNQFTVAGAKATNDANGGIITAVFPATAPESSDTTLTSTIGKVYNSSLTIADIPKGTTLADFEAAITPALGATFNIYERDGITPATELTTGDKVIVTAENIIDHKTYTVMFAPISQ